MYCMKGGALKRKIEVWSLFSFLHNTPARNVARMFKIKEKQIRGLRMKDNED